MSIDQIKAVISENFTESREETYDIYLLPPGEDPEACQSYLRMRNRDGKYNLMFEASLFWQQILALSYVKMVQYVVIVGINYPCYLLHKHPFGQ